MKVLYVFGLSIMQGGGGAGAPGKRNKRKEKDRYCKAAHSCHLSHTACKIFQLVQFGLVLQFVLKSSFKMSKVWWHIPLSVAPTGH